MALGTLDAQTRAGEGPAAPYVVRTLALALGLALAVVVLASGVVRCPTALLLHVPCPACGTTRAARALFACDLAGTMRLQPLTPVVLFIFGALGLRSIGLVWRHGHAGGALEGRLGRLIVALVVVSAIAEVAIWALRWLGMFGGPVLV